MPSNNTGIEVKQLFSAYPDKIALLLNPFCLRPIHFKFRYAIDNGAYKKFDEDKFFKMLDFSKKYEPPMFLTVPDVVGCHDRTMALWNHYYSRLSEYEYPLAFVAQDGCEPNLIPKHAKWIFIGGKDPWKMNNLKKFIGIGKKVHVGRVNGIGRLRYCESLGVDSIDGTGWMQFRGKNYNGLMNWFKGFNNQMMLFE
jgi:hypothetical protein